MSGQRAGYAGGAALLTPEPPPTRLPSAGLPLQPTLDAGHSLQAKWRDGTPLWLASRWLTDLTVFPPILPSHWKQSPLSGICLLPGPCRKHCPQTKDALA